MVRSSPPQLRRGGAPKGEPDRAKPQSKAAGVVLIQQMVLLTNTTPASLRSAVPSSAEEGSFLLRSYPCLRLDETRIQRLPGMILVRLDSCLNNRHQRLRHVITIELGSG